MQGCISIGINIHINTNMNMILGIHRSINVKNSIRIMHLRNSLNISALLVVMLVHKYWH